MIKNTMNLPTLKEIETDFFRTLQITYSETFSQLLTELDQILAENRDKMQFQLKDKCKMTMDSLFGSIEVNRNYYYDREGKKYVSLLDQHLQFVGANKRFEAIGSGDGDGIGGGGAILQKCFSHTKKTTRLFCH